MSLHFLIIMPVVVPSPLTFLLFLEVIDTFCDVSEVLPLQSGSVIVCQYITANFYD